jgi:hypothetical protein
VGFESRAAEGDRKKTVLNPIDMTLPSWNHFLSVSRFRVVVHAHISHFNHIGALIALHGAAQPIGGGKPCTVMHGHAQSKLG